MRQRPGRFRAAVPLLLVLAGASPAAAQMEILGDAPGTAGSGSVGCGEINARAMEASLVVRQHASALSAGFEPDARPQAMVLLAWLDQWAGRLRGLVDVGQSADCLDDGDAETYRRALVAAARVGNQAREELLRTPRAPQAAQQQQQRRRP
ncbi:hypothetical protein J5Y09_23885 [Roseomonas sp. PWR1]|uniref:UrcA family protein n=1 Tax=Roseomonas nitratireducens TaxID=2820810 RepID=A0ABS4B029_9PROT|nr:hypothetical protein [Neoroseomonas nitratireducens]MBP0466990.1 hypothetical protein [Neoroseomonas nitratireducens]